MDSNAKIYLNEQKCNEFLAFTSLEVSFLADSSSCSNYMIVTMRLDGTLQKHIIGCFNCRVVILVADKLKRQWLQEVCLCMEV